MSEIPATACSYNNQYFDSKVEALWAAYFDAVGLEWYREPDTFELRSLTHGQKVYTPDYYVPQWDSYVEIKDGIISWQAYDKMRYLARGVGKAVILLNGRPNNQFNMHLYSPDGAIGGNFTTFHDEGDFKFSQMDLFASNNKMSEIIRKARNECGSAEISRTVHSMQKERALQVKQELYESRRIVE